MSKTLRHASRFPIFQRLWKPAVITGTAVVVWWDEIMLFGEEILALISLFIMAGVLYILDIFMFKSRFPRHEDPQETVDKKYRN